MSINYAEIKGEGTTGATVLIVIGKVWRTGKRGNI
jgi:hypothetical protein